MQKPIIEKSPRESRVFVSALARGLAVVEAFEGAREALSLADVARRVGIDRAVARRMLLTLEALGFVAEEQRRYRLTPEILRLGFSFLSQSGLADLTQPFLVEMTRAIRESCSVAVLEGSHVVSVAHAPSPSQLTSVILHAGTRWPAYAMASGRILLSGKTEEEARAVLRSLPMKAFTRHTRMTVDEVMTAVHEARKQGYAVVEGELEEGLMSVSIPILNRSGRITAALNSSTNLVRRDRNEFLATACPIMQEVAERISKILM